jgi:hypothetical protein
MKKLLKTLLAPAFLVICMNIGTSQTEDAGLKYYGRSSFLLEGTQVEDSLKESPYDRLPRAWKEKVRKPVWNLSKNSAGISIRFHTNSSRVSVKWKLLNDFSMNHMASTGIKGVDLYCKHNNRWQYVNTGRPTGMENEQVLIHNMQSEWREFKVYLPLYDGVVDLEIGVDSLAGFSKPEVNYKKPIVFYGTSITQGGCASRTGMAHSNIISRELDIDCINFGFSGNGTMEEPIIDQMAEIDASIYVVECLQNMTPFQVSIRTMPLVKQLRENHPHTPILLVDHTVYSTSFLDEIQKKEIDDINITLKKEFSKIIEMGIPEVYFVSTKSALGNDQEGTVDGVHFTDLGYIRMADFLMATFDQLGLVFD